MSRKGPVHLLQPFAGVRQHYNEPSSLRIGQFRAILSKIDELLCKGNVMSRSTSVKVSSRYQIAVPRIARDRLKIEKGDRLLVDVQDGLLILLPLPKDHTAHLAGLHSEVWADLDTDAYLREERDTWNDSEKG